MSYVFDPNMDLVGVILPRYIFRYVCINQRLYDSLKNSQLWFASPNQFNDPFDCRNIFDFSCEFSDLKWYLNKNSKGLLPEEVYDKLENDLDLRSNYLRASSELLYHLKISQIAICCFSLDCEIPLLWSHYSNGHRGVCLVFDTIEFLENGRYSLMEVQYTDETPRWNQIQMRRKFGNSAYFNYSFDQVFLGTKTLDWQYELEIRAISHIHGLNKFKRSSLVGIILGTKCTRLHRQKLETACSKLYPSMEFYEEVLDLNAGTVIVDGIENKQIVIPVERWKYLDKK